MLDLDASLYENGFFKTDEIHMMQTFHNQNITDKVEYINNLDNNRIKALGARIIGRNYFDSLSNEAGHYYNTYLNEILFKDPKNVDFRGTLRTAPNILLRETKELLRNKDLDSADQNILNSLKDLILEKTRTQQDLGF